MQKQKQIMSGSEIIEAYRDQSERSLEEMIDAELALLQAELDAIRAQPPKGWLVTGSKTYEDAVVATETMADNRIKSRGVSDPSRKIPLIELPS